MKIFALIIIFLLSIGIAQAAYVIWPDMLKERYGLETVFVEEEEGYLHIIDGEEKIGRDYFFFENEKIPYPDFIYQYDGRDYIENMPCVPEGKHVWRFEYCCEGTEPYLEPNRVGQSRCAEVSASQKFQDRITRLTSDPSLIISIVILLVIVAAGIFFSVKKLKKNK